MANSTIMQHPQLKTSSPADIEAHTRIRMAIRTMMMLQHSDDIESPNNKKRQAPETSETPPAKKRRIDFSTDSVLDEAADEVCLETEWERVLADWNPEKENLPFPTDTLVGAI